MVMFRKVRDDVLKDVVERRMSNDDSSIQLDLVDWLDGGYPLKYVEYRKTLPSDADFKSALSVLFPESFDEKKKETN